MLPPSWSSPFVREKITLCWPHDCYLHTCLPVLLLIVALQGGRPLFVVSQVRFANSCLGKQTFKPYLALFFHSNRIPPNRTVYTLNTYDSVLFVQIFARRITGKINCCSRQGSSSKNRILCLPLLRFRMALVPTRPDQEPPNGGVPLLDQVRIQDPRPSRTSPQL